MSALCLGDVAAFPSGLTDIANMALCTWARSSEELQRWSKGVSMTLTRGNICQLINQYF